MSVWAWLAISVVWVAFCVWVGAVMATNRWDPWRRDSDLSTDVEESL